MGSVVVFVVYADIVYWFIDNQYLIKVNIHIISCQANTREPSAPASNPDALSNPKINLLNLYVDLWYLYHIISSHNIDKSNLFPVTTQVGW